MAQFSEFIKSDLFDTIPTNQLKIRREKQNEISELTYNHELKFILNAPIGSGKSTAACEWMTMKAQTTMNDINGKVYRFIVIVPTVNIAYDFYNKIIHLLIQSNTTSIIKQFVCLCVKDGAFEDFKKAVINKISIIITTYSTASRCLGSLVEASVNQQNINVGSYSLIIDEAHMLLNNISLIEIIRDFVDVGLISATINDVSSLSIFKDFHIIKPNVSTQYKRNLFIHQLNKDDEKMRKDVIDLIHRERANYDKVLIKIEDKKQGQLMKEALKEVFNVALYNGDKKDVEINGSGKIYDKYDENRTIDIIISTSTIQSGQSLTENVLQIFIQTPIDTISSVEQFIGRNRLKNSTTHLFMRLTKDKCNVRQSMNRYEYHLNHLRAIAWHDMTVSSWQKVLSKLGRVIVDDSIKDSNDAANDETRQAITKNEATCCLNSENKPINDIIINKPLNKLFNGLKKLYKYYGFKSCPSGYSITMNKLTIKGKRTRCYKLIKDDETNEVNESTDETNEANESTNNINETSDTTNDVNTSDTTNDATSDTINDKPLNQLFRGKRELFKFYNITTCPSNCIIKMKTLNESGKRTRAYWLTLNEAV